MAQYTCCSPCIPPEVSTRHCGALSQGGRRRAYARASREGKTQQRVSGTVEENPGKYAVAGSGMT